MAMPAAPPPPPNAPPPPPPGAYPAPMGMPVMVMAPPPVDTNKPIVAGVFFLISALIGAYFLPGAITLIVGGSALSGLPIVGGFLGGIAIILGILFLLGFIGPLIAAIFCFMKKQHMLAMLGGILGLVGLHFVFNLVGIIMLAGAKDAFKK